MKICTECNIILHDNARFCPKCGNKASQPQNQKNHLNKKNKIANTLFTIGILIIFFGVIGSFIMGAIFPSITYDYSYFSGYDINETYNWGLVIAIFIVCVISGICFIGFSEIINLLQENIYQHNKMIESIKESNNI